MRSGGYKVAQALLMLDHPPPPKTNLGQPSPMLTALGTIRKSKMNVTQILPSWSFQNKTDQYNKYHDTNQRVVNAIKKNKYYIVKLHHIALILKYIQQFLFPNQCVFSVYFLLTPKLF